MSVSTDVCVCMHVCMCVRRYARMYICYVYLYKICVFNTVSVYVRVYARLGPRYSLPCALRARAGS